MGRHGQHLRGLYCLQYLSIGCRQSRDELKIPARPGRTITIQPCGAGGRINSGADKENSTCNMFSEDHATLVPHFHLRHLDYFIIQWTSRKYFPDCFCDNSPPHFQITRILSIRHIHLDPLPLNSLLVHTFDLPIVSAMADRKWKLLCLENPLLDIQGKGYVPSSCSQRNGHLRPTLIAVLWSEANIGTLW